MKNRPTSTALQEELYKGLSLAETEAGMEIRDEMAKLERKLRAEHKAELNKLRAAQRNCENHFPVIYSKALYVYLDSD